MRGGGGGEGWASPFSVYLFVVIFRQLFYYILTNKIYILIVVMGGTLGTGTFKPEKNLVFFRIKSPGPHRCHPGKLE